MSMKTEIIEYWLVENSGWSNGVSWFSDSKRYINHKTARDRCVNLKSHCKDPTILYRVTHVQTTFAHEEIK